MFSLIFAIVFLAYPMLTLKRSKARIRNTTLKAKKKSLIKKLKQELKVVKRDKYRGLF